jgi:hypothetical protein
MLDLDVKAYFDSIDWELMLRAVRRHTNRLRTQRKWDHRLCFVAVTVQLSAHCWTLPVLGTKITRRPPAFVTRSSLQLFLFS